MAKGTQDEDKELIEALQVLLARLGIDPMDLLIGSTSMSEKSIQTRTRISSSNIPRSNPGILLREMRQYLDLKQEDLAQILDVRAQTVSRWERGETQPREGVLQLYGNEDTIEMTRNIFRNEVMSGEARRTCLNFLTALCRPDEIHKQTERYIVEQLEYPENVTEELLRIKSLREEALWRRSQRTYYFLYDKDSLLYHIKNHTIPREPFDHMKISPDDMRQFIQNQIELFNQLNAEDPDAIHLALARHTLPYSYEIISKDAANHVLLMTFRDQSMIHAEKQLYALHCEASQIAQRFLNDFDHAWDTQAEERDQDVLDWLQEQADKYLK